MKKLITWKPTSNFRHKLTNQRLGDFPGKIGDPLPNLSTNPRGSRNKPGRSYFIQRECMIIIIISIIIRKHTKIFNVRWFWWYTKLVKTKNMLINWYYSAKNKEDFVAFWCWKLTLKIRFWHFLTAIYGHITSLISNQCHFCDQYNYFWVQSWL